MKYLTEDYTNTLKGWVSIYKGWRFGLTVDKAGYFDERPQVNVTLTQVISFIVVPILVYINILFLWLLPFVFIGYGKLYIHLPIRTGIQDCDSAGWGIDFHNDTLWIYTGGGDNFEGGKKWITFEMPYKLDWVRTSMLLKTDGVSLHLGIGEWEHEVKGDRKDFYNDKWNDLLWEETHDYLYTLKSGKVQERKATIHVSEREWRPLWFKWTKLFSHVRRSIDVEFSDEVGERTGSWKGGTIGCGYHLLKGEIPLDCLRRMEKERKF